MHFRGGREAIDAKAYPDIAAFYDDLARLYREEIADLAGAGCRYLQIDEVNLAYLCDPELRKQVANIGEDPGSLPRTYAKLLNDTIKDRPKDMTVCMHLCRGNFAGAWVAEGGYEPIAELLFNQVDVDGYFLEYDTERAGGLEPLRFLPKGKKRVVVGLVTGFAGIVILVWPDIAQGGVGGREFLLGVISVQLACAGWAIGSSYTRRHVMPADVLGSAAMQMIFGGMFLTLLGTTLGEWGRLSFTGLTLSAMVYLVLAGSVIAFTAYSYALRHLDVATVSLYTYINPVIAVGLGTLLLDEPFHMRMVIAAAVILVGTAIVGRKETASGS
jgi:uncharacterized membrane protein